MFDVDLMNNSGSRGNHLEIIEGCLAPAQELIALMVALVLYLGVPSEGVRGSKCLCYDGMVNDHFRRSQRIYLCGIPAEIHNGLPHSRKVHHTGHAREILHDDTSGSELNLVIRFGTCIPAAERTDVVGGDVRPVLRAQQVLEQDLQAIGQPVVSCNRIDSEDLVGGAIHIKG